MIKPDAMKRGYAGAILDMMIKDGFRVVALKQLKLTPEKAGEFMQCIRQGLFLASWLSL
jgi:nucleoside-diphosphate kinase